MIERWISVGTLEWDSGERVSGLPEAIELDEHKGAVGIVRCNKVRGCFFGSGRWWTYFWLFSQLLVGERVPARWSFRAIQQAWSRRQVVVAVTDEHSRGTTLHNR
jgi:hypothetical protein